MRRSLLPIVAATALLQGCPLPDRDNPFDPASNAYPTARLSVRVRGVDGVERVSLSGTRNETFVLDARASSVDNGTPLTYAWETDDAWDAGDPDDFDRLSNEGPGVLATPLALTSAMLVAHGFDGGVGSATRRVRVRVTAGVGGPTSIASVSVVVRNDGPAVAGESEPWFVAPGNPPSMVTLDACGLVFRSDRCRVSDPDGDSLTFQWEQTRGTPVTLIPMEGGRRARFGPGNTIDPRGYEFEFTASDGLASAHGTVEVLAGSPMWYATANPSRLVRVFPEFRVHDRLRKTDGSLVAWNGTVWSAATEEESPGVVRFWASDDYTTYRIRSNVSEITRWSVPATSIAPAGGGRACVSSYDGIHSLRANGTSVRVATSDGLEFAGRVVPAGPGACWTLVTDGSQTLELGRLVPATDSYTPIASDLEYPVNGGNPEWRGREIAVGTADGGAWLALGDGLYRVPPGALSAGDLLGPDDPIPPDGYLSLSVNADALALEPDGMTVMAHRYGGSEWFRRHSDGRDGGEVVGLPTVTLPGPAVTDVAGSSVLIADQSGLLHRCRLEDGVASGCRSVVGDEAVDASGASWNDLALDPVSADALAAIQTTPANGRYLAVVPTHGRKQVVVPVPISFSTLALSPDPTSGALFYSDPPVVGEVGFHVYSPDGAVLSSGFSFSTNEQIRPYLVTAVTDGGAWMAGQGDEEYLIRVDSLGVETERYELGQEAIVAALSSSPDGSTVCIAINGDFFDGTPPQELLRRRPDGVLESLGTNHFQLGNGRQRAAAHADGSCWFGGDLFPDFRALRFGPSSTSIAGSYTALNDSVDYMRFAVDPRDGTLWIANGSQVGEGSEDHVFRLSLTATVTENYPYSSGTWPTSVYDLAIRKLCATANDPSCIEVWQLSSSSDGKLYRSDGRIDKPVESMSVSGIPSALGLAP